MVSGAEVRGALSAVVRRHNLDLTESPVDTGRLLKCVRMREDTFVREIGDLLNWATRRAFPHIDYDKSIFAPSVRQALERQREQDRGRVRAAPVDYETAHLATVLGYQDLHRVWMTEEILADAVNLRAIGENARRRGKKAPKGLRTAAEKIILRYGALLDCCRPERDALDRENHCHLYIRLDDLRADLCGETAVSKNPIIGIRLPLSGAMRHRAKVTKGGAKKRLCDLFEAANVSPRSVGVRLQTEHDIRGASVSPEAARLAIWLGWRSHHYQRQLAIAEIISDAVNMRLLGAAVRSAIEQDQSPDQLVRLAQAIADRYGAEIVDARDLCGLVMGLKMSGSGICATAHNPVFVA